MLVRTNRLLTGLGPGLFTSCLYVHLARHRARLAGAGHPPPVLRRPDGRAQVLRVPPNLLLGVDAAADCTCTQVDLPPGSVLVLCTDGLVEVPGTDLLDSFEALAARGGPTPVTWTRKVSPTCSSRTYGAARTAVTTWRCCCCGRGDPSGRVAACG
ncbi:PP2C family protein-serine/threonine phosphatase [Streptomyces althioticus]|uniref:PP2C family protein-serine/threonine phosphatase n=1 Tax=Streptomyces althioticus TaxID=83380 RepID=UPI003794448A